MTAVLVVEYTEEEQEEMRRAETEMRDAARIEALSQDPIAQNIKYRAFVSKSKGIRNGKRRVRRKWKEVELFATDRSGFHLPQHFPFDTVATEVTGDPSADDETFRENIVAVHSEIAKVKRRRGK